MSKCAESSKIKVNRFMFRKLGIKIYLFTPRDNCSLKIIIGGCYSMGFTLLCGLGGWRGHFISREGHNIMNGLSVLFRK